MAQAPSSLPIGPTANVVIATIKPIVSSVHVQTINPSVLDLGPLDSFIPIFFAYRPADKSDSAYSQFLNRLKESLQQALVPFFGFAGRWIEIPNKSSRNRQLLCNDEGVSFIEVYMDQTLDSIVNSSAEFQPAPKLQGFELLGLDPTQVKQEMLPDGLPCLFVQVTRFSCGGVVIAPTFNHMLTDGKGFFNFLTAWSDLSRTNETTMNKVDFNRELAEKSSFKEYCSKRFVTKAPVTSVPLTTTATKLEQWTFKALEVSASAIETLKQEAREKSKCAPGFVSTGDCILAHVWKSLSRQSSSILAGKKKLVFTMNVEGRSRCYDPSIPDLCGNVTATMVAPQIPIHELQEMSVASIASKIREKLHNTKREEWLSFERLEATSELFSSAEFAVIRTTSWSAFPLYDIDFGFGKPYFSSGINNFCVLKGSMCAMYIGPPIPSSSASIATVYIWSTPEVLDALDRDSEYQFLFLQ
ncbi:unnamed protein product [Calypogeia fissa]